MNRQRTTWNRSDAAPRQAATSRRADVYTMNQDHPQPGVTEYENGDPDSWAETPTENKNVSLDYEGDHVRRNEVGFGEIRKDTFDHKDSAEWNGGGKYDNAREAATRKAACAVTVARSLLRTDDEAMLLDQATDLMALPPRLLAATARRIEKLSPDSLDKNRKTRRALACCKLATRILTASAPEDRVEHLANVLMTVDDPTLKEILRTVASVRLAEEEDDKDEGQTASPEKDKDAEQTAAPEKAVAQAPAAPVVSQEQQKDGQQAQSQGCMTAEDMQALDQMLSEDMGCAPAPALPAPGAAPELQQLFTPPVPAVAPLATQAAPARTVAEVASDISFDDGDEDGETQVAGETTELSSLFDEHPEVVAQREIQAAEQDAHLAASGYTPAAVARTASTSAKRIGNVRPPARAGMDDELGAIWERPPAM